MDICRHDAAEYNAEHDNFYCIHCKEGMGPAFYAVAKENMNLTADNKALRDHLEAMSLPRPYDCYWSRRALEAEAKLSLP